MSAARDDRTDEVKFEDLKTYAEELRQRFHVPGVALGLAVGEENFTAGLGITSVAHPLAVTPETIFQIGSTTKTFTATALMRLAEQGRLVLDDRVRKHLPDFRVADEDAAAGVTLRHLLTHTPGWLGDFFPETGRGDNALAGYVARMADLPQKTPLGAFYSYNNAALVVAGRVIEAVTGQPYEAAIRELIFEPLEMTNSFFFPEDVMLRRFAVGHLLDGESALVADPWPIIRGGHPAGGVASDVIDQLKYARFHLGDGTGPRGERLLRPASLRLMQTPQVPMGDGNWVGLTWTIEELGGVRFYSHGGTTNGQESDFWIAPEKRVAFTTLTNLDQGNRVHEALRAWVREHYLGIVKEIPRTVQASPEELAGYTSSYYTSTGDLLEFRPEAGGLMITHVLVAHPGEEAGAGSPIPPMRAGLIAPDRFLVLDSPFENAPGEFLRGADGGIRWMRLGGRIFARCV